MEIIDLIKTIDKYNKEYKIEESNINYNFGKIEINGKIEKLNKLITNKISYFKSLPKDYLEFLYKYGSESFGDKQMVLGKTDDKLLHSYVSGLLSLSEKSNINLFFFNEDNVNLEEFIYIGLDRSSSRYLMGLNEKNFGKIYYEDEKMGIGLEEIDFKNGKGWPAFEDDYIGYYNDDGSYNVYFNRHEIADNFTEFINGLMTYEEIDEIIKLGDRGEKLYRKLIQKLGLEVLPRKFSEIRDEETKRIIEELKKGGKDGDLRVVLGKVLRDDQKEHLEGILKSF